MLPETLTNTLLIGTMVLGLLGPCSLPLLDGPPLAGFPPLGALGGADPCSPVGALSPSGAACCILGRRMNLVVRNASTGINTIARISGNQAMNPPHAGAAAPLALASPEGVSAVACPPASLSVGDSTRLAAMAYRFRFTSSCNISSLVVMMRAFAWNARWVWIRLANSLERSTLDNSSAPAWIRPMPFVPGASEVGVSAPDRKSVV